MRLIDADQWVTELEQCPEEYKAYNQWLINEIEARPKVYTEDEERTVNIVFSHEHWGSTYRCPSCGALANISNKYCPGCGKNILWEAPEERTNMSGQEWFVLLQKQEKKMALNQKELSEMFYKKLCRIQEHENGGWIPCSERLPETKDDVLIYWGGGNMSTAYYVSGGAGGWFFNYGFDNPGSSKVPYEPKAWRPLPESYKL